MPTAGCAPSRGGQAQPRSRHRRLPPRHDRGIGVFVADAGYHSEANLTAPGPDRLIADGKTRALAAREPAEGPPPAGATATEANAHRLATPEGRAAYKRRAPDVEGLHASLKDDGGLRRFSLRGLHNATSEFLSLASRTTCGCWPPSAELNPDPARPRSARPGRTCRTRQAAARQAVNGRPGQRTVPRGTLDRPLPDYRHRHRPATENLQQPLEGHYPYPGEGFVTLFPRGRPAASRSAG